MVLARIDLCDSEGDLHALLLAYRSDGSILPPGLWRVVVQDDDGDLHEDVRDVSTFNETVQEIIYRGNAAMRKRCG